MASNGPTKQEITAGPSWLDEAIRHRRGFSPRLSWFLDRLPGRARTLLQKATEGRLRAHGRGVSGHLVPVRTLREFIALPARTLLLQPSYGYSTHLAMCCAFRASGFTGELFGADESTVKRTFPYVSPNRAKDGAERDESLPKDSKESIQAE